MKNNHWSSIMSPINIWVGEVSASNIIKLRNYARSEEETGNVTISWNDQRRGNVQSIHKPNFLFMQRTARRDKQEIIENELSKQNTVCRTFIWWQKHHRETFEEEDHLHVQAWRNLCRNWRCLSSIRSYKRNGGDKMALARNLINEILTILSLCFMLRISEMKS